MEKRTLLAVALAILVLLAWSLLTPKFYPIDKSIVTEEQPITSTHILPTPAPIVEKAAPASTLSTFQFEQEEFDLTFIESRAALKQAVFKDYGASGYFLHYGLLFGNQDLSFRTEKVSKDNVQFVYEDQEKRILKDFNFHHSPYALELVVEIHSLASNQLPIQLPLVLGVLDFSRDQEQARFQDVTIATTDNVLHLNGRKDALHSAVQFIAIRDRYFTLIVQPDSADWQGRITKINSQSSEISLQLANQVLAPGQQLRYQFLIYLGPQDLQLIKHNNPAWSAIVYFGKFDFIGHLLLRLLDILYRVIHNWGGVVIVLSILIYFLLFPLSLKQMRSMKQMQTLQPLVEELRTKYKDNPQKLNKEIMELYRQHKVNPLSGCLPMVLQIPIFFALYQVLIRSIALKGARFLWIKDLSEPDRLMILPVSLPILGNEVNILPILMAIGMFMQQKITMKSTGGQAAEQQKLMLIVFPVMFGFIFYRMPSGLVLYWFINSILMLVYQFRINRSIQ